MKHYCGNRSLGRSCGIPFSNPLEVSLDNLKLRKNEKLYYAYDFGDQWEHEIRVESIRDEIKPLKIPICVTGKRACPPEDIGGPYVYPQFLREVFSFQQDLQAAVLGDFKNFAKDPWDWVYTAIDEYKLDYPELMWSYARFEEDAFDKKKVNEKLKKLYQKKGDDIEGMASVVQEVCQESYFLV